MPDNARILTFPARWESEPVLSGEEARDAAHQYFKNEDRSQGAAERHLGNPDILAAVCKLLRDSLNTDPTFVAREAFAAYTWLRDNPSSCLFDEHDYFLGEIALLAAGAERLLGNRAGVELWLERAEAAFRHTVNPGPSLAQVSYVRLTLRYDKGAYDEVLDLLPSAVRSFERLGMKAETAKTRYLEAMTLKELSRRTEAFEKLRALEADLEDRSDIGLLGQVLAEIGALHNADKRFDDALACYQRALKLVSQARRTFAVADLKLNIGEVLRNQGQLSAAVEAFREGVQTFEELGMTTWTAFARLALADTLLALGRPRQAEWEIQAALPVIEEQKMVPEGLAAVALLRESVRQRQANPRALREIREHLQAQS